MSSFRFIGTIQIPTEREMDFSFKRILHSVVRFEDRQNNCNYSRCFIDGDGIKNWSDYKRKSPIRALYFEGQFVHNYENKMRVARLVERCKRDNLKFSVVIIDNENGWEIFGDPELISAEMKFDNGLQEITVCI